MTGVATSNLDTVSIADEVIVNRDGSTARMSVSRLAAQVRAEVPGPHYETRAALFADLDWPAQSQGSVWGDVTEAYRGLYTKSGASGAGSWARYADLPQTSLTTAQLAAKADTAALTAEVSAREAAEASGFVLRLVSATGTAQAVTAEIPAALAHIPLAARQLVAVVWPQSNTGADPVLTIGGVARVVRGPAGTALAAGDLRASRYYTMYVYSGTEFRLASGAVESVAGKSGVVVLAKADVGLGNVDNTPDASKPVSTAQAAAIAGAASNGDVISLANVAGSGDALTADLPTSHAGVAMVAGTMVNFVALANNSGPVTLTLAGTPYLLRGHDGGDLIANMLRAGRAYTFRVQGAAAMRATGPLRVDDLLETADAKILTGAERAKLASVESGAQVNAVVSVAGKSGAVALVKADVGLGSVDNTPDADKPISTAQAAAILAARDRANHTGTQPASTLTETADAKILTAAERTKLASVQAGAQVNAVVSVAGKSGAVALVKADVGLGSVDNTPDADKPVSVAQAAAIAGEAERAALVEAQIGAGQRPGDFAAGYGADLTGALAAITSYGDAAVVVDPLMGRALKLTTATHCALRAAQPLEPGRVYEARWVVRREIDPSDPSGDAVEIGVRWLTETQTGLAGGSGNRVHESLVLTVAMGLVQRAATFSIDVPGVSHVIPAAARYGRPWVRSYGTDHQTHVGRVDLVDVTAAWQAAAAAAAAAQPGDVAAALNRANHTGTQPADTLTETADAKILTAAERTKLAGVEEGAQVNAVVSVAGRSGAVALVKADVGLGSVDNTPDADKPVSTAQAAAIATAAATEAAERRRVDRTATAASGQARNVTPGYLWDVHDPAGRLGLALDKDATLHAVRTRQLRQRNIDLYPGAVMDHAGRVSTYYTTSGQLALLAGIYDASSVPVGRNVFPYAWGVFDRGFTTGIGLRPDGTVDVTLSDASRAQIGGGYVSPAAFATYEAMHIRRASPTALVGLVQEADGIASDVRQIAGVPTAVCEHRRKMCLSLAIGQSNVTNTGVEAALLTSALYPHHVFAFNGQLDGYRNSPRPGTAFTWLEPRQDPADQPQQPMTLTAFAREAQHRAATGRPTAGALVFVSHYGGQPLTSFLPGTVPYANLMLAAEKAVEIAALYDREVECPHVTHIQGEHGPFTGYGPMLADLAAATRADVQSRTGQATPPVFVVVQTSEYDNAATADTVFQEQWTTCRDTAGMVCAGPMYQCPVEVDDPIHLSGIGRMVLSDMLGDVQRRIEAGEGWTPLQPSGGTISGSQIDITFDVPFGPIAFDDDWIAPVPDRGFVVTVDGAPVSISSVTITGPDSLRIVLAALPTGVVQVQYAVLTDGPALNGWTNGRGHLYSPSPTPAAFHALGFDVPAFVRHPAVRFTLDL